jgi:hypothetical protein
MRTPAVLGRSIPPEAFNRDVDAYIFSLLASNRFLD